MNTSTHGAIMLEQVPDRYKPLRIMFQSGRRPKHLADLDSVDLQHLIACMRDLGLPTEPLE